MTPRLAPLAKPAAATIIREALAEGVMLALTATGTIKATGDGAAVNRWLSVIREHKAEIIGALKIGAGDTATAPRRECIAGPDGALGFHDQYSRARELEPLTTDEERAILAWLAAVGETDTSTISEVLAKCQRDARARAYVIDLASELPPPAPPGPVRCGDCAHFERSSHHPNLGHCASGQPEAAAGLADADLRRCSRFNRLENGGRAEYAN